MGAAPFGVLTPMSRPTFVEKSPFGSVIFQINGLDLEIVNCRFGNRDRVNVPLRSLNAKFTRVSRVIPATLIVPLFMVLISAVSAWWLLGQDALPRHLIVWSVGFGCLGLVVALQLSRPFVFYQFKDQWGRLRFSVMREKHQAAECDAFVAELTLRIQITHSDLPANTVSQWSENGPYHAHERQTTVRREWKWSASLVLGTLANLVLLLPGATPTNGAFILLFPLICAGLLFGGWSIEAKEQCRFWGAIGISISLLPLVSAFILTS